MKLSIINFCCLKAFIKYSFFSLLILLVSPLAGQALTVVTNSKSWYIPHQASLQFAGNAGLFSVGPGYTVFRQNLQVDVLYGFTPHFQAEKGLHALTLKAAYHPFRVILHNKYQLEPLKIGTGFNYTFGPQFFITLPERYPENYYWWSSRLRFTPFIGSTLIRQLNNRNKIIKNIQVYTELGTHDLALVSWLTNENLPLGKIFNLNLGVKFGFR